MVVGLSLTNGLWGLQRGIWQGSLTLPYLPLCASVIIIVFANSQKLPLPCCGLAFPVHAHLMWNAILTCILYNSRM